MSLIEQKMVDGKQFIINTLRAHLEDDPIGLVLFSDGNLALFPFYNIYDVAEKNVRKGAILMLYCFKQEKSPEENYRDILKLAREIDVMTREMMCNVLEMLGD